ncbi:MAG TPA: hypothetical protein VMC84_13660 [Methanocella sp.]|uniref:hypothetical protein n=1 Tax=Methanocella sp. TaxID=2052833 RepID=UPI002B52CB73|nr:hypothetical protein [Methanocella sp.]HTY92217.1 hypothetical protein [Methanocella sp.]
MTLDTYLPEGDGKYIMGSARDTGRFFYFMPKSPDHVKIGFLITASGKYIDSEYKDVIIYNPESQYDTEESGEYHIARKGRYSHTVELNSHERTQRFNVYAQPRLGRFRLLSESQ